MKRIFEYLDWDKPANDNKTQYELDDFEHALCSILYDIRLEISDVSFYLKEISKTVKDLEG